MKPEPYTNYKFIQVREIKISDPVTYIIFDADGNNLGSVGWNFVSEQYCLSSLYKSFSMAEIDDILDFMRQLNVWEEPSHEPR